MTLRKFGVICRRIVFILLLLAIVVHMWAVFERKTLDGAWNYTTKIGGFVNEPEGSFDIIGVGSSHMYCSISPVYLYEQTGLRSYLLATQEQPREATHYYIKEALERQSPDVVIIESYMYVYDTFAYNGVERTVTEGVAHGALDPFPNTKNKLDMIEALPTEDAKENYYFNFLKYHTRWKELTDKDFDLSYGKNTDPMHGYVFLTGAQPNESRDVSYDEVEAYPIDEAALSDLERTVNMVREAGAEPLLLIAPYQIGSEHLAACKYLAEYAEKNGIAMLDMNTAYDEIGLDNQSDFYDSGHLNVYGAEKASLYLADFIRSNFEITEKTVDDAALWQEDVEYYNQQKNPA